MNHYVIGKIRWTLCVLRGRAVCNKEHAALLGCRNVPIYGASVRSRFILQVEDDMLT